MSTSSPIKHIDLIVEMRRRADREKPKDPDSAERLKFAAGVLELGCEVYRSESRITKKHLVQLRAAISKDSGMLVRLEHAEALLLDALIEKCR